MTSRDTSTQIFARRVSGTPGLAEHLLDVVGAVPEPREPRHADPAHRSREIARTTAVKAALSAGVLALPPGPLGWITIAPELYTVWRMQAQMVADIAGAHGKRALLSRELMLYCLFSHTAAGAFRQLVIQVGEQHLIRRAPLQALYAIANKVALRIAQRSAARVVTRWVPLMGAAAVSGYVYLDTGKVADNCIDLFSRNVRIRGEVEVEGVAAMAGNGRTRRRPPARARKRPDTGT
ncbi:MAG TPA: hypothetical protein VFG21_10835 [Xanthomonadaceae bacterium]|nr:hypothetical protein [Xanthomonadaceae bacterium]